MKRVLLSGLFVLWVICLGSSQTPSPGLESPQVQDATLQSQALGREIRYRVILPAHYAEGGRFPVLYLLHGLYGDYLNWDTRTGLENYARHYDLLIVMPDAGNSWYTNSAGVAADKFEDFLVKDLIPEVDNKYRTIRDQHARAIAGLSMGGYGAIKFALKYPGLFRFAGSLSGALNAAQDLDAQRAEFRDKLVEVFGPAQSKTRKENDVFQLLKGLPAGGKTYFYLACGSSDFFLPVNRAFAEQLAAGKFSYEYHETAGGHTWEYWDQAVQPLLEAVQARLSTAANP
ncbi:MAG: esterase family protein [Acidobacteria bacterium]|nr:esterase family protein [Acidobacteriota bacterium]